MVSQVVYDTRNKTIEQFYTKKPNTHIPYIFLDPALGTSCAPSVLIIFINMMLMKSSEDKPPCRAMMYAGQNEVQRTFLAIAFLCIPIMLFGKPVYKAFLAKKRKVRNENYYTERKIGRESSLTH